MYVYKVYKLSQSHIKDSPAVTRNFLCGLKIPTAKQILNLLTLPSSEIFLLFIH